MPPRNLPTVALAEDTRHLSFGPGNLAALAERSAGEAVALADWQTLLKRFARALHPLLTQTPPRLGTDAWRDAYALLGLGWRIRRLGRRDMRELLRIGGMCVHDLLEERFSLPLLKGALALDAVLGTNYGPRSPGTVLSLLYRCAASQGADALALPEGGLGAVSEALARAARAAGAEIRTGALVERILVREDHVAGVVLACGEEIAGDHRGLERGSQEHVPQAAGDGTPGRGLRAARDPGALARAHGQTAPGPRSAAAVPGAQHRGAARAPAGGTLGGLHRARLQSRQVRRILQSRRCSRSPSRPLADATLAPPGKHVMSVIVQYAPYALAGGWDSQRPAFTERVIDTLGAYAPQLRDCISASELLAPPDIEREFRISGGHWHHAELALDQFLMVRPVPGAAQYRTPLPGLFLCGAGCHPGGGVMGLAGRNAARQLIREAA